MKDKNTNKADVAPVQSGEPPLWPWTIESPKNITRLIYAQNRQLTSLESELLAACHSAANRLECLMAEYSGTQSDKDTLRTLRAAIAKAEEATA